MLFVNQNDYPDVPYRTRTDTPDDEYGRNSTIKTSGCGLCCSFMVADRLLVPCGFSLEDAIGLSYSTGANHRTGTDFSIYAPAFAKTVGLKMEKTSDFSKLDACLKTGGCVIAHVRTHPDGSMATFTKQGHYITVIGIEPDGRYAILDPSYTEDKYDVPERKGKVEMKGFVALCSKETLAADIEWSLEEDRGFYLFWRE